MTIRSPSIEPQDRYMCSYSLPGIKDLFALLSEGKLFSIDYLVSAYQQILLDEE